MKKFFNKLANKIFTVDAFKALILIFILYPIIKNDIINNKFDLTNLYDTSILVSFILVFICEAVVALLLHVVNTITEDDVKLESNYKKIVEKYCLDKKNMIVYCNKNREAIYIPEILLTKRKKDDPKIKIELLFDETNPKYEVPTQIKDNSSLILQAHSKSKVYNNINIRTNDLIINKNVIKIKYGYTTYFDSLLTNRAMDYEFKPRITVREIYEPGPYISSFLESKLSNHIGFNGFVELKDGNIILVKRGKRLSIGKRKWQQSIGASLKSGYCLDGDSHQFKEEGIYNSIKKEISDELKLDLNGIENNDIDIFAFYRDLVEGGKPQFLFYYKTDKYDKEDFQRNFKHKIKESKKNKNIRNKLKLLIDGNEFEFLTPNELDTFDFNEYQMFKGDYLFSMTPSSIASILLFLDYLGYNKIKDN